jgi:2-dehydro-3-deoxygalactonokinase
VLHHLFGVRALGLFGELESAAAASYLSGLLIGHEVGRLGTAARTVHLLGSEALMPAYQLALEHFGHRAIVLDPDSAVRGLWQLAQHLPSA